MELLLMKAIDSLNNLGDKHLFLTQEDIQLVFQLKQIFTAT